MMRTTSLRPPARSSRRGQAVLSAIVAMLLGALVVGGLVSFWIVSENSARNNSGRAETQSSALNAANRMVRDIRDANKLQHAAVGEVVLDQSETDGTTTRVRYSVDDGRLLRTVLGDASPTYTSASSWEGAAESVVARGVSDPTNTAPMFTFMTENNTAIPVTDLPATASTRAGEVVRVAIALQAQVRDSENPVELRTSAALDTPTADSVSFAGCPVWFMSNEDGTPTLFWDRVDGVDEYVIFYDSNTTDGYQRDELTRIAQTDDPSFQWEHTTGASTTASYYEVTTSSTAAAGCGVVEWPASALPDGPTLTSTFNPSRDSADHNRFAFPTSVDEHTVSLSWNPVTGADRYQVWRLPRGTSYPFDSTGSATLIATTTAFSHNNILHAVGQSSSYYIQPITNAGAAASAPSNEVYALGAVPRVTATATRVGSNNEVTWTRQANDTAARFLVEVREASSAGCYPSWASWTALGYVSAGATPRYVHPGVMAGAILEYRVSGQNYGPRGHTTRQTDNSDVWLGTGRASVTGRVIAPPPAPSLTATGSSGTNPTYTNDGVVRVQAAPGTGCRATTTHVTYRALGYASTGASGGTQPDATFTINGGPMPGHTFSGVARAAKTHYVAVASIVDGTTVTSSSAVRAVWQRPLDPGAPQIPAGVQRSVSGGTHTGTATFTWPTASADSTFRACTTSGVDECVYEIRYTVANATTFAAVSTGTCTTRGVQTSCSTTVWSETSDPNWTVFVDRLTVTNPGGAYVVNVASPTPPPPPPPAPSAAQYWVVGSERGTTGTNWVEWNSASNATAYRIQRQEDRGVGGWTTVYSGSGLQQCTTTRNFCVADTGRPRGTESWYRVISVNSAGDEAGAEQIGTSAYQRPIVSAPELSAIAPTIDNRQVSLDWGRLADANDGEEFCDSGRGGCSYTVLPVNDVTGATLPANANGTDTLLTTPQAWGSRVRYSVRACNAGGCETVPVGTYNTWAGPFSVVTLDNPSPGNASEGCLTHIRCEVRGNRYFGDDINSTPRNTARISPEWNSAPGAVSYRLGRFGGLSTAPSNFDGTLATAASTGVTQNGASGTNWWVGDVQAGSGWHSNPGHTYDYTIWAIPENGEAYARPYQTRIRTQPARPMLSQANLYCSINTRSMGAKPTVRFHPYGVTTRPSDGAIIDQPVGVIRWAWWVGRLTTTEWSADSTRSDIQSAINTRINNTRSIEDRLGGTWVDDWSLSTANGGPPYYSSNYTSGGINSSNTRGNLIHLGGTGVTTEVNRNQRLIPYLQRAAGGYRYWTYHPGTGAYAGSDWLEGHWFYWGTYNFHNSGRVPFDCPGDSTISNSTLRPIEQPAAAGSYGRWAAIDGSSGGGGYVRGARTCIEVTRLTATTC